MIGLVSCSQQKLSHPAPARELYCSPLFKQSLAYAEARCDRVYVLSAKYELVETDQVLEPYDQALSQRSKRERQAWGTRVADRIRSRHQLSPLMVLAGADYVMALRWGMVGTDQTRITEPLKGLMIGERLAFLRRAATTNQLLVSTKLVGRSTRRA
jgi:hypothetical protein